MTALASRDGLRRLTVAQGEMRVCRDPEVVLTTVLGSCVATCFYDPFARIGGLNHYLLAEGTDTIPQSLQRYGLQAMEVLINAMLAQGAMRSRLKARIFGGARMHAHFADIGGANVAFARTFLRDERIPLVGEDVGGTTARRVEFRAGLGLARCRTISGKALLPVEAPKHAPPVGGEVEFF